MNPNIHRFKVGRFDCTIVGDGTFAYTHPAAVLFASAPPTELAAALHQRQLDPATWEHYLSPYPSLVIDTGNSGCWWIQVLAIWGQTPANCCPTCGRRAACAVGATV